MNRQEKKEIAIDFLNSLDDKEWASFMKEVCFGLGLFGRVSRIEALKKAIPISTMHDIAADYTRDFTNDEWIGFLKEHADAGHRQAIVYAFSNSPIFELENHEDPTLVDRMIEHWSTDYLILAVFRILNHQSRVESKIADERVIDNEFSFVTRDLKDSRNYSRLADEVLQVFFKKP